MHASTRLKVHRLASATVLAIGLALMTMMILVESEPGLLPLLMVVGGGAWLLATQLRMRRPR